MHNPFNTDDANQDALMRQINIINSPNMNLDPSVRNHKVRKASRKARVLMTSFPNVLRIARKVELQPKIGEVYTLDEHREYKVVIVKQQSNKNLKVYLVADLPSTKCNFDIQISTDLVVQTWNSFSITPEQLGGWEGVINEKTMTRLRQLEVHYIFDERIPLTDLPQDESRVIEYLEKYSSIIRKLGIDPR